MICRFCLHNSTNCFHFFESEGCNLNAATIIRKHFWFEPKQNDIESLYACRSCWSVIDRFHNLYIFVENSQKLEVINETYDVKCINEFQKEIGLKFENESLKSGESTCKDFTSGSEFFQDSLDELCQDSLKHEVFEKDNGKLEARSNESKIISVSMPDEEKQVKIIRSKRIIAKKNKNALHMNEKDQFGMKIKPKMKRRGRPSLNEKSSHNNNSKISEGKRSSETVSDEEIYKMKRISCHICMIEIPTFLELKKHFSTVHNEEGYAICCEKKFYKRYKFVHHLKMHCNPNEFRCPHCDKQLGSKKYVTLHIKNMHTKVEKIRKHSCETCGKSFAQKGVLARHMLTHVPDNEKLFHCDQCGKTFPTQGVLRTHKITVHEGRYGGICALCGKKYQNPQDLKRHCLIHEGISEPKAQCEVCGDWLANKYKLKRHMVKHNTAHLEHKCPHCNKLSPNEIALKSHIKFAHNESNKIHQCSVCEKAFRRRIDLKEHMTVHTGEHLYTCPHCPRTFTHHSNVHHHRKKMHRKEFDEERAKRGANKAPWIQTFALKKDPESTLNLNTDNVIV